MIYRLVTCLFLGLIGFMFLSASSLAYHMADLGPTRREGAAFWPSFVAQLFEGKSLVVFIVATTLISFALLWPGIVEFVTTAHVSLHWSRLIVGTFGLAVVVQSLITNVLMRVLSLWRYQRAEAGIHRNVQNLADRESSVAAGRSQQLIDSAT
jgi:hypothetical protein